MIRYILPLTVALSAAPVFAAPPPWSDPNSAMARWFESLTIPGTDISCCSAADCRPHEYRIAADYYQIKIDDKWIDVPPQRVLRRENPTGEAIACIYHGAILCFDPPSAS